MCMFSVYLVKIKALMNVYALLNCWLQGIIIHLIRHNENNNNSNVCLSSRKQQQQFNFCAYLSLCISLSVSVSVTVTVSISVSVTVSVCVNWQIETDLGRTYSPIYLIFCYGTTRCIHMGNSCVCLLLHCRMFEFYKFLFRSFLCLLFLLLLLLQMQFVLCCVYLELIWEKIQTIFAWVAQLKCIFFLP